MDKKLTWLIALGLLLYGSNFWSISVYVLDEAKNSGCAMEMYDRNDWIVPTFNDELRTDKPPLHYYFMRAGYEVFGVSPFAARLFSVLVGVALIIVVYLFTKDFLTERAAFLAGVILVTSIQMCVQFHLAVPDPYLIFFLSLGLLSFFKGYQSARPVFYYIFYIAISLATLAKGPVAVVFAGLIVFTFLLTQKKFSLEAFNQIRLIQGALIFVITVLPWYYLVGVETEGEWLRKFFMEHNVGRFTSTMEGHGGFPLASFVILLVALMPFSFFAPQAIRKVWQVRNENPFVVFCLVAAMVVVIFFAFSKTILPNYPEPAVPFFAIVLAFLLSEKTSTQKLSVSFVWSALAYMIVAVALPVAAWFGLRQDPALHDLSFLSYYFIILSLGGVFGLWWIYKRKLKQAIYTYALSLGLFLLVFFYVMFPLVDARNPVRQSLVRMEDDVPVLSYKGFNPAFVLARKQTIPNGHDVDEIIRMSAGLTDYYIITQSRYANELRGLSLELVHERHDLFEGTTTIVFRKSDNGSE